MDLANELKESLTKNYNPHGHLVEPFKSKVGSIYDELIKVSSGAIDYDSSFQEFVTDLSLTTRNKLPYNLGTYDNALKLCNYFKEQKCIFNKNIKLSKREHVVFRIISGRKAASLLPSKSFKYKKDRHIRRAEIRCNSHDLTARREIKAYYRELYKIKHSLLTRR